MLDFDLATMYGVENRALKQSVRRNMERFPDDFLLKLSSEEANRLIAIGMSQNVIPQGYNIGTSEMFSFTELGVSMLSSVLRSERAIQMNIAIMRAFVAMRSHITSSTVVTAELAEIRAKLELLERNDEDTMRDLNDLAEDTRKEIDNLYNAIGELSVKSVQVEKPRRPIGYRRADED